MSCWWDISSHTSIEYMWRKYEIWPLAAVLTSGENRLATFVHKHTRPMYFINRQGLFRPTGLLSNEISFKLHLNKSLLLFNLRFDSNSSYTWNLREQQQQRRLLWSLALMIVSDWLTHWNWRLAISHVWHHPSRIVSCGNICLVSLMGSMVTLDCLVTPVTLADDPPWVWSPWKIWTP